MLASKTRCCCSQPQPILPAPPHTRAPLGAPLSSLGVGRGQSPSHLDLLQQPPTGQTKVFPFSKRLFLAKSEERLVGAILITRWETFLALCWPCAGPHVSLDSGGAFLFLEAVFGSS